MDHQFTKLTPASRSGAALGPLERIEGEQPLADGDGSGGDRTDENSNAMDGARIKFEAFTSDQSCSTVDGSARQQNMDLLDMERHSNHCAYRASESDFAPEEADGRREAKREYNRVNAAKSREKRKRMVLDLQASVDLAGREYSRLQAENKSLRDEVVACILHVQGKIMNDPLPCKECAVATTPHSNSLQGTRTTYGRPPMMNRNSVLTLQQILQSAHQQIDLGGAAASQQFHQGAPQAQELSLATVTNDALQVGGASRNEMVFQTFSAEQHNPFVLSLLLQYLQNPPSQGPESR